MKPRPVSALSLRLSGWQYEGDVPSEKKYVALAVPHTSNWDGLLLVLLTRTKGIDMKWMLKDDWVKGPLGPLMRSVGAVPINRSRASHVVDQMIAQFRERERFILGIPPEGTRRRTEYWKSGFYHIALGADVPVVPGYLDFGRKRAGLGPAIRLTGNVQQDMDKIRAFYAAAKPTAFDPSKFGPLRLREESDGPPPPR